MSFLIQNWPILLFLGVMVYMHVFMHRHHGHRHGHSHRGHQTAAIPTIRRHRDWKGKSSSATAANARDKWAPSS